MSNFWHYQIVFINIDFGRWIYLTWTALKMVEVIPGSYTSLLGRGCCFNGKASRVSQFPPSRLISRVLKFLQRLHPNLTSSPGASQSFLPDRALLSGILSSWKHIEYMRSRNWYPTRPNVSEHLKIPYLLPVVFGSWFRDLQAREHISRLSL